jgi:glutamine synthetase type III
MSHNPRQHAVREISTPVPKPAFARPTDNETRLPGMFGSLVFNDAVQRQRLPKSVYSALRRTIDAATSSIRASPTPSRTR